MRAVDAAGAQQSEDANHRTHPHVGLVFGIEHAYELRRMHISDASDFSRVVLPRRAGGTDCVSTNMPLECMAASKVFAGLSP
jgi:hypothetical protein